MGAYGRTPWYRRIAGADRAKARDALARVGLADRARERFGTLSRGQRQRVLIARALVQDAPVLLLDEPFAGVDAASAERITGILAALRDEGRALLVATHDIDQARGWDRVLSINRRQVAFGPPAEALSADALERCYGGEIVVLEDGRRAVAVGPHDHAH
jgi:manganese/iron transport system ATP-binding protein/manganese/zinc/iron transport system ATP- binding protein